MSACCVLCIWAFCCCLMVLEDGLKAFGAPQNRMHSFTPPNIGKQIQFYVVFQKLQEYPKKCLSPFHPTSSIQTPQKEAERRTAFSLSIFDPKIFSQSTWKLSSRFCLSSYENLHPPGSLEFQGLVTLSVNPRVQK